MAFDVLRLVHQEGAYANLALPKALEGAGLSPQDRAFATELTYGCLRREGELDLVIEDAASRVVSDIDDASLDILRLAVYQAFHMRVPEHALVNEAVNQAKRVAASSAGFVNAVLRSILRKPRHEWDALLASDVSIVDNHPRWIVDELERALAECPDAGTLSEALRANNEAPLVTLALLPGLAERKPTDRSTMLSPLGVVLENGSPGDDERVRAGVARVQDEGSQLAALVVRSLAPIEPGERWLDMCAGPGGKTAVLAAVARQAGATVLAVEKQPHRTELVRKSLTALQQVSPETVDIRCADSLLYPEQDARFDRILLDAPCSGLGALRRRPEARWRKSAVDLPDLVRLQTNLLARGLSLLRPGGSLVYVTCSPVVEETSAVIAQALSARNEDIVAVDTLPILETLVGAPIPGARRHTAVQLWPHVHRTDAMFIQVLRRRSR